MRDADWHIEGPTLVNCNCAWGCPCQFNALPTSGQCEALWAMRIDRGHLDEIRLDGLHWGALIWWPGPVHEGGGKQQLFYEERADAEQRRALETIARGDVSAEGTYFQIFSAVAPDFHAPIAAPIEFRWDMDARTATLVVPNLVEARLEPIRNPVTGAAHRAKVAIPKGFEYREAEYASGSTRTQRDAAIALDLSDTHAHFYHAAWDASGVASTAGRSAGEHAIADGD